MRKYLLDILLNLHCFVVLPHLQCFGLVPIRLIRIRSGLELNTDPGSDPASGFFRALSEILNILCLHLTTTELFKILLLEKNSILILYRYQIANLTFLLVFKRTWIWIRISNTDPEGH